MGFGTSKTVVSEELASAGSNCVCMPKYFFKLDNDRFIGNPNGTELVNLDAARDCAGKLAQNIASELDLAESCSISVIDESEKPVLRIAFPPLRRI
jgi:uncharacterized protein DUF6894